MINDECRVLNAGGTGAGLKGGVTVSVAIVLMLLLSNCRGRRQGSCGERERGIFNHERHESLRGLQGPYVTIIKHYF